MAAAVAAAVSLALAGTAVQAAPEDDYKRGQESYNRGDVVGAMSALRPPAAAGHAPSQALLAYILEQADFIEEAISLYRSAAASGNADGHVGLGTAYAGGRGVAKDEKLALQHFSKAADLGHGKAIDLVAEAYLDGQLGRSDATPDAMVGAVRRAAERGHLPSAEALAAAYRLGRWGLSKDQTQADLWARKVAELKAKLIGTQGKKKGSR